jgi:hypothetical protein
MIPGYRHSLLALAVLGLAQPALADVITDWNEKALALVEPRVPPAQVYRARAMVHVAMFDAVNSIEHRYRPYLVQFTATPQTSKDAAAAAAASAVLAGLLPQARDDVNTALRSYLETIPSGKAKDDGIRLGDMVGAKILEARANDGADEPDSYRPRTTPGVYVPTAPTFAPMWANLRPFALTSPAQFRPEPPPKLDTTRWAADYNEIKELGSKTSPKRSAKQTEDARFWLMTGSPYDPIVRQIVATRQMSVLDASRFMALTSVAMEDAIIAVLDAKYHYEFWRPITAIRNGDLQNNPAISRDPSWQPIDNTPMHPEYPCAHCIVAASIAAVMEGVLGRDVPEFSAISTTAPGITHRWSNAQALVKEVSQARIWAGFHYRFSTQVGADMGYKIGGYVIEKFMQPLALAERR